MPSKKPAKKTRPAKAAATAAERHGALERMCWAILLEGMPQAETKAVVETATHWLRSGPQEETAREAVGPLLQGFTQVAALVATGQAPNYLADWFATHGFTAWEELRPFCVHPTGRGRRPSLRTALAEGLFIRDHFGAREHAALYLLATDCAVEAEQDGCSADQVLELEQKRMSNTLRVHGAQFREDRKRFAGVFAEMREAMRAAVKVHVPVAPTGGTRGTSRRL